MATTQLNYSDVLDFWFIQTKPAQWWQKSATFDQLIKTTFLTTHQQAVAGELYQWRATPQGRLAEIIVLDQFSRNIFRDTPFAFAYDSIALILAQEAVSTNADQHLAAHEKSFLYMPYMHSESASIHEIAVELYKQEGLEDNLDFEFKHKAIIDEFGRYPHRNDILGRKSSPEEVAFLTQPGSSF